MAKCRLLRRPPGWTTTPPEKTMASDASPTGPAPESLPEEDEFEFEFDPADELEPTNAFVDVVLTRAGEFTLDLIEAVQEHPVLAASLMAAGFGAVVGLVAGSVARHRAASAALAEAAALQAAAALEEGRFSDRLGAAQRRLGQTVETASTALRERRLLRDGLLSRFRAPSLDEMPDDLAAATQDRAGGASQAAGGAWRKAQAAGALFPLGLELLRNEIVRDLVAHALAGRLRRSANL
jgi:hypothetical protein